MVDKHVLFYSGAFISLSLSLLFLHCIAVELKLAESALNHLAGNDENCHFLLSAQ